MKQRIVFLLEQPFSPRNYERYGFEVLLSQGFEPQVWDFIPFLNPSYSRTTAVAPEHEQFVRSFRDADQAVRAIEAESADIFFINLIEPTPEAHEIYRALHRSRSRYAVMTANAIPAIEEVVGESVLMKLARLRRLMAHPRQLFSRVAGKLRWLLSKNFSSRDSQGPALWIAGGARSPVVGAPYPRSKRTRMVWAHTLDYDNFLRAGGAAEPVRSSGRAVFLDQYVPYHPDYAGEDMPPPAAGPYFSTLQRFFDQIEQHLGLPVDIAAHPRADYGEGDVFGNRRVVKGRTLELVRESSLVLGHSTTAINWAVLYEKPVMFLTMAAFSGRIEGRCVESMAGWLARQPVNIDADPGSIDWSTVLTVNRNAYRAYREAFIKTGESPDILFWQIVADAIRSETLRSRVSSLRISP